MLFYHMELAKRDKIETFVPRVPDFCMPCEAHVERVCVSDSIEGCLSAVAWGGSHLDSHPIGTLFRVYVFDEEDYIVPECVATNYNVIDAIANREYWFLHEVQPIESFLIEINNFNWDNATMINGRGHVVVTNLDYRIVNEKYECGDVIDLVHYSHIDNLQAIIFSIIENLYLYESQDIFDVKDDFCFIGNKLIYRGNDLFYKTPLLCELSDNSKVEWIQKYLHLSTKVV